MASFYVHEKNNQKSKRKNDVIKISDTKLPQPIASLQVFTKFLKNK